MRPSTAGLCLSLTLLLLAACTGAGAPAGDAPPLADPAAEPAPTLKPPPTSTPIRPLSITGPVRLVFVEFFAGG